MRVEWRPKAEEDLLTIAAFIAADDPVAALALVNAIKATATKASEHPKLYRAGRVRGTREAVVRPNYVLVYQAKGDLLEVVRVLHARRQWP
ncbi:MAG: type II toxin-antitoxin system RelE/ParE family toxin [Burkholderiales bacterium]|nr:type II toxin-antitoxin system RelE/ParE family toxin [Burkholderiales bacterium]